MSDDSKRDTDRVETFKVDHGWNHPYPWLFRVHYQGRVIEFRGVPNQCATRRQAAIRGWWRLRWLRDGTYDRRYK